MSADRPDDNPESKRLAARVLRAYSESIREFRLVEDAARAHRDQMLTWVIGLMGGGVLAVTSLGVCSPRARVWAAAPWVVGVAIAVAGRIAGEFYRNHPGLISVATVYLIQLRLAGNVDAKAGKALLDELAGWDSNNYRKKADRAQSIARWCYGGALGALLIGLISVFWRIASC